MWLQENTLAGLPLKQRFFNSLMSERKGRESPAALKLLTYLGNEKQAALNTSSSETLL